VIGCNVCNILLIGNRIDNDSIELNYQLKPLTESTSLVPNYVLQKQKKSYESIETKNVFFRNYETNGSTVSK